MPDLRQSTSQIIRFGPFADSTDGVTPETGLTIAQADMQLSKDGGAFAQKNTTGNATHDADGYYSTTLDATDTNTTGILRLQITVAGSVLVWEDFDVVTATYYDAKYSGTYNNISPAEVNAQCDTALADYDGPTNAELNARTLASADYFDPASDAVATVTNLTNLPSIPTNWLTASGIAASALDGKGDWNIGKTGYSLTQAFPTNFSDLSITATTGQVSLLTATQASIDAIEGDLANGGRLDLIFDAILTDTGTTIPAQITALNDFNPTTDTVVNVTNVTGEVDANITKINSVTITGDGSVTPFDV